MRRIMRCAAAVSVVAVLFIGCDGVPTKPTGSGTQPAEQRFSARDSRAIAGADESPLGRSGVAALSVASPGALIVQQAEKYVGSSSPERCDCKTFVRKVVLEASNGRVSLPATSSNSYEWNLPSFGVKLFATKNSWSPHPIYGIDRGDVIQMLSSRTGLHTLIVKANMGSYFTIVEANYKSCAITDTRSKAFSDFLAEMTGWTAYRVAW